MRIKQLRIKAGLSQKDLAERLNVAQPSVHSWENGDADPKTDKLPALAEALGCTIDELFREPAVGGADCSFSGSPIARGIPDAIGSPEKAERAGEAVAGS